MSLDKAALQEMETLLRDLGFDPGAVDGVVDDDTIAAIRRYQDFALLPGEPEPDQKLLDELRGVAAAFAALNASNDAPPATPAPGAPEPAQEAPEGGAAEATVEKIIVPPPPPPPKLKPPEAAQVPESAEVADPAAAGPKAAAELPPGEAPGVSQSDSTSAEVADAPALPDARGVDAAKAAPIDPRVEAQAKIDAELAPYREDLASGRQTRENLARQFNQEGQAALQQARYEEAVRKFSAAIYLDPAFAGAYSNRGTAYQRQDKTELAAQDFAKARELGFSGLRLRDGANPFN